MVSGEDAVSFGLDTGVLGVDASGVDVFDADVSGAVFGLEAFGVSISAAGVFCARVSGTGVLGVCAIAVGAELPAIDPRAGAGGAFASA